MNVEGFELYFFAGGTTHSERVSIYKVKGWLKINMQ